MTCQNWCWVGASSIGTSHNSVGEGCEDSAACIEYQGKHESLLIAAVSDGAGSADFANIGSRLVVRGFVRAALSYVQNGGSATGVSQEIGREWIDGIRDRLFVAAQRASAVPRDFAATLVGVIAANNRLVVCHVGDGSCVVRDRITGEWIVPSWPAHGEYASSTYFVTDDPEPHLRVVHTEGEFSDIAIFSDGIERLVLDFTAKIAFARFFDRMFAPIKAEQPSRDRQLSRSLRSYLDSKIVSERTDDDKTLVMARKVGVQS
jgi:hypothetical protein